MIDMKRRVRNWRRWIRKSIENVRQGLPKNEDQQIGLISVLVVVGFIAWWVAGHRYGAWTEIWKGVHVEAAGALMDLVVFGIIVGIAVALRERKRQVRSHQELINDFKKWDSEEARYRIAGAVRRLNRLGRTSIDFVGMEISSFYFREHDIESIAGSRFYLGDWISPGSRGRVRLQQVDFSHLDCSNVIFSAFQPLVKMAINLPRHAQLLDCRFWETNLRGANFNGALLAWTEPPPENIGHWEEMEDGEHSWVETHISPFRMADLKGASFENAAFENADFRQAQNLEECRFAGATGLDDCVFDSDEVKESVLRRAGMPTREA